MATVTTAHAIAQKIGMAQVLPVLRTPTDGEARDLALRLLDLGLSGLELTTTIPNWPQVMTALRSEAPNAVIGMGTVVTRDDAALAIDSGAQFLVSPYPAPGVRTYSETNGTLFIEGGFTPAELASATSRGVAKLFPAHVGGPTYLKSMLAVLPGSRIIPTGGVPSSDVPLWLAAGAFAVGVGSDLYTDEDMDSKVTTLLARLRQGAT